MTLIILRGPTGTGKSTILNLIAQELNYKKIDIDDIKIKNHGTVTTCNPSVDFKEAGVVAEGLLLNGHNVVVEESFLNQADITYFLGGLQNVSPRKFYIRTECSVDTAILRKKEVLPLGIIKFQHSRPVETIESELVFNTDKITSSDIIKKISQFIMISTI